MNTPDFRVLSIEPDGTRRWTFSAAFMSHGEEVMLHHLQLIFDPDNGFHFIRPPAKHRVNGWERDFELPTAWLREIRDEALRGLARETEGR